MTIDFIKKLDEVDFMMSVHDMSMDDNKKAAGYGRCLKKMIPVFMGCYKEEIDRQDCNADTAMVMLKVIEVLLINICASAVNDKSVVFLIKLMTKQFTEDIDEFLINFEKKFK